MRSKIAEIPLLLTQRRAPPGTLPEARISGKPQPHTPPKCRWPHPAAPRTAFTLPGGLFAMSGIVRGGGPRGPEIRPLFRGPVGAEEAQFWDSKRHRPVVRGWGLGFL